MFVQVDSGRIFLLVSHFSYLGALMNIKTVEGRARLQPRREPYYEQVRAGCFVGYRRMSTASEGTWVARCRAENGKQKKDSLGDLGDVPKARRFDAAVAKAEAWFGTVMRAGDASVRTVADACAAYVKHVEGIQAHERAADLRARYRRWVEPTRLAGIELARLKRGDIEAWRRELTAAPVVVNPHAPQAQQVKRERSPATVNRDVAAVRAALNHAHAGGYVASDTPWRLALKAAANADKARSAYLTLEERRRLLEQCEPDLRELVAAMCSLPLRPGAMAALTVADFDARAGVLRVGKDKAGRDRRITLPATTAAMVGRNCASKTPAAAIFTRSDGKAWDKDSWKKPFKAAVIAADLNEKTTMYSLRHCAITDLVPHLDLLSIAQISGTSVAMIEKHYGHLQQGAAQAALARLSL